MDGLETEPGTADDEAMASSQHGTEPHFSADVVMMPKICGASRSGRSGWSSRPSKQVSLSLNVR